MRICIGLVSLVLLFCFASSQKVFASEISITNYPVAAVAGQEFEIGFLASGIAVNQNYNIKGLGGESFTEVDTWNNEWLQQNASWSKMPVFTSNMEGSASGNLKIRFDVSALSGSKQVEIRIRRADSSGDNIDSSAVTISLTAAPQTPTPVPSVISTPTSKPDSSPAPTATQAVISEKTPLPPPAKILTPKSTPQTLGEEASQTSGINTPTNIDSTATPSASDSRKNLPYFAIIFIALGLILIGLSFFLAYKKKNTDII